LFKILFELSISKMWGGNTVSQKDRFRGIMVAITEFILHEKSITLMHDYLRKSYYVRYKVLDVWSSCQSLTLKKPSHSFVIAKLGIAIWHFYRNKNTPWGILFYYQHIFIQIKNIKKSRGGSRVYPR